MILYTDKALKNPTLSLKAAWFSAVLVAPIVEEVFFRGTLQAWLQRQDFRHQGEDLKSVLGGWTEHDPKSKDLKAIKPTIQARDGSYPSLVVSDLNHRDELTWAPVILSSALFALIHIGQGAAPIPLFVLAMGVGFVYRQTGSIVPCIVVHFLLNAFTMTIVTVSVLSGN